jgi:hypothetical protein
MSEFVEATGRMNDIRAKVGRVRQRARAVHSRARA